MLIIASYIVMILYAALSLSAKRSDESRVGVGFAGIGIVALAVASSFGLAGLLDIAFNPTSTQVLPFLALGLGVDDMFVLAHHFKAYGTAGSGEGGPPEPAEMVRLCLTKAGPSITLTTVVNGLVFLVGSLTPIPAVTAFCLQAALAVCMNYLLLLTVFPVVMALDARRALAGRRDVLCCAQVRPHNRYGLLLPLGPCCLVNRPPSGGCVDHRHAAECACDSPRVPPQPRPSCACRVQTC